MNPSQFQQWCRARQFSAETVDLIARIRFSPPTRRVQGGAGNVCGTYPSRKMGVTIQFESYTVELGAIYLMEHDEEVEEYYDQPPPFKLSYETPSGRKTTHFHTPDFFVICKDQSGWEEWKTEEQLHKLAEAQPFRYQNRDGRWQCPPGDEYASAFGLSYRVRSSAELPRTFIDNLDFLEDYLIVVPRLPEEIVARVQTHVRAAPGISLAALLGEEGGIRANDVYALIALDQLYVDLSAAPLSDHFRTRLYLDQAPRPHSKGYRRWATLRADPPRNSVVVILTWELDACWKGMVARALRPMLQKHWVVTRSSTRMSHLA